MEYDWVTKLGGEMDLLTKQIIRKAYLTGFIDGQSDSHTPNKEAIQNAQSRLDEVEAMINLLKEE